MLVGDVIRRKGDFVATISPDASVRELLAALAEHNVGAVVVSADGATVIGVVSERDVVRSLHSQGDALLDAGVDSIMTSDVVTATADEPVEQMMLLMTKQRIRHVPVLHEERLVGVVSIGDVVKIRMDELEHERESLIGYISSGG